MKLVPYRRFTIESPLPPAEVQARLRGAVEEPRTFDFRFGPPERPLVGRVDGATFDVMRNVTGRNSFRPRVRGTIEAAGRGSRLTGTMRLHELVMIIMGSFLAIAGSVFLSMAGHSLRSRQWDATILIPLGVVLFLSAMTVGGFFSETRSVLAELTKVVDASGGELV